MKKTSSHLQRNNMRPNWGSDFLYPVVLSTENNLFFHVKAIQNIRFRSFFKDFIYVFMRDTQIDAETPAEGEAGSTQGARCGTRSRVCRITPWAEGRHQTSEAPRHPKVGLFNVKTRKEKLLEKRKNLFFNFPFKKLQVCSHSAHSL